MPDQPPPILPTEDALTPSNERKKPKNPTAVAITHDGATDGMPRIVAAGRGKLAEQILQLAFDNGINVREDSALAEMLAKVELDSPIPSEAFLAVAEVLTYVYKANGQPNPFDTLLEPSLETPLESVALDGGTESKDKE